MPKRSKDTMRDMSPLEIEIAAKVFAIQNLGQPSPAPNIRAVNVAWDRCQDDHGVDGIDVRDELLEWQRLFKRRDRSTLAMWFKEVSDRYMPLFIEIQKADERRRAIDA